MQILSRDRLPHLLDGVDALAEQVHVELLKPEGAGCSLQTQSEIWSQGRTVAHLLTPLPHVQPGQAGRRAGAQAGRPPPHAHRVREVDKSFGPALIAANPPRRQDEAAGSCCHCCAPVFRVAPISNWGGKRGGRAEKAEGSSEGGGSGAPRRARAPQSCAADRTGSTEAAVGRGPRKRTPKQPVAVRTTQLLRLLHTGTSRGGPALCPIPHSCHIVQLTPCCQLRRPRGRARRRGGI